MATKRCPKCGETKDVSEFGKKKGRKDGLQPHCKACCSEYVRAWKRANKEKLLEQKRAYRQANKEKIADYKREYRQANKEKIAEKQRAYQQSNKEKLAEYNRAYRKDNKEKLAEYHRAYWKTEAGKDNSRRARNARRARKCGAAGFHDFAASLEIYGDKCALCGDAEAKLTVGHIIPLSKGGSNWQWNIRPECASCNCSKGTKLDEELSAEWWDARPDGSEWPTQQV